MKRFIRVFTAVLLSAAMAISVSAADKDEDKDSKKKEEAKVNTSTSVSTICFDTDKALKDGMLKTFGAVEGFGLKMDITDDVTDVENKCLVVSMDTKGAVDEDKNKTGFYIDSKDFGLDSFEGCEITAYVYAKKCGADKLQFFTDGQQVSYDVSVAMTNSPRWEKVTITPPDNAENNLFGMIVTSSSPVNGTVCYIENITIKNSKGERVKNIGDFRSAAAVRKSMAGTAILTVVLILAVAGICSVFVMKNINKYR